MTETDLARVCPLVADAGDRLQLERFLDEHEQFVLVGHERALDRQEIDLLIVDEKSLHKHRDIIASAKRSAEPILLPVLLLVPDLRERPDQSITTLIDSTIEGGLDEIIEMPIRESELLWRLETLLRLRRQSKAARRQSERFETLFEDIADPMVMTDTDGAVTEVNDAFLDLTGYESEDVRGRSIRSLVSPLDPGSVERLMTASTSSERVHLERANGSDVPVEASVSAIGAEETGGQAAVLRDISDRLERERERRQYENAVESATNMLAAADRAGRLLFANEQYREFHGLDREEIDGRALDSIIDEAAYEALEPRYEAVLDGERVSYRSERERGDGQSRIIESSLFPLEDDAGETIGVVAAIRDVTDREERIEQIERLSEYTLS
ncbi:MAG: PAS domain-containing protein, partial [Halodesulfurarchaeum sp.]